MGAGRWSGWKGRLDALLPEGGRGLSPDDLSRYRVLAGATLLVMSLCVLIACTHVVVHEHLALSLSVGACALGLGGCLLYLHTGGSLRLTSLLVCGLMLVGYLLATYVMPQQIVASHAASAIIILLAVYLLGMRVGLGFTLFCCLNAGVLLPLYQSDFGARGPLFANTRSWAAGLTDAVILLMVWGLSALFSFAREEAASTVSDSEYELKSLLESTSDPVCSLDTEGRIIKANSGAYQVFREMYGLELRPGDALDQRAQEAEKATWHAALQQIVRGESVRYEWSFTKAERTWVFDLALQPLWGREGRPVGVTLFGREISERKAAETKIGELHRVLMEVSRQAGMAEMATGVLHNVGNMFNSVNVSASLVIERLKGSRAASLARATELLGEHETDLLRFLTEDGRGQQLPKYLSTVSRHLMREQEELLGEMRELVRNVEHIRAMVSLQQSNARLGGHVEMVHVAELLDDALRLHRDAFEQQGIRIQREYAEVAPQSLDRHRLLQIIVNLLGNARHALMESGRDDKCLSLRVRHEDPRWLSIQVEDNGVGIAPENLARMFSHGFTTKKDGHGFGLHSSTLAAEAMHGRLRCDSRGRGLGACFTLELPLGRQEPSS